MLLDSVGTIIREGGFARFPAVGAIVKTIGAQAYALLTFANSAIFFADAIFLSLVALHACRRTCRHGWPPARKLYLSMGYGGKAPGTAVSERFI